MNSLTKTLLPALVFGLVGCAEMDQAKDVPQPDLAGGKADSLRAVDQQGVLSFGEPMENSFEESLTFHGYRFSSLAGGEVAIEVTQRGSSRGLDTTMWLYGLTETEGWEMIAFDDDDGWGTLSRLPVTKLGEHGEYMIVVGTADGMGLGNYRVALECTNDACVATNTLAHREMTPELEKLAVELWEAAENAGTNTASLEGWTVATDAEITAIGESVRENYSHIDNVFLTPAMDQQMYRTQDFLPVEVLDAIEATHGTGYTAMQFKGMHQPEPGVEKFVSVEIVYYADLEIAFTITFVAGR